MLKIWQIDKSETCCHHFTHSSVSYKSLAEYLGEIIDNIKQGGPSKLKANTWIFSYSGLGVMICRDQKESEVNNQVPSHFIPRF